MMPSQFVSQFCFNRIHASNLVYNTCWEDPRIDRQAMDLTLRLGAGHYLRGRNALDMRGGRGA